MNVGKTAADIRVTFYSDFICMSEAKFKCLIC